MARGKETFGVVKSLLPHCRRLQEAGMRTEMVGSPGPARGSLPKWGMGSEECSRE